jgi:hypothetical protein
VHFLRIFRAQAHKNNPKMKNERPRELDEFGRNYILHLVVIYSSLSILKRRKKIEQIRGECRVFERFFFVGLLCGSHIYDYEEVNEVGEIIYYT